MNLNPYITTDYKNISDWTIGQSKPNSNPIKPNLRKAKMNVNSFITKDYRKKDDFTVRINKPNFQNGKNECKLKYNKGLWQFSALRPPKKQTQTKPIFDYPCVFEWLLYNLVLNDGNRRYFNGEYVKWQMHQKQMQ